MSCQIPLPTVDQFTSELDSVGPKWYDVGIFLGITTHEMDVIGENHGTKGTQRCLIELFKCFQTHSKPLSWNDIIDALIKIHNNCLADCIREKYIQTASSSYLSSPLPGAEKDGEKTRSDSQMMETSIVSELHDNEYLYIDKNISNEFNKIITSFASLVLEIRRVLQKKSVSIHEIQVVLQESYEIDPLSTEVATLERVFGRMRQHYCFLNYRILAYLVDKFLSNEKPLVQLLKNYTKKLETFKKSAKIKHLMKLIKEKRDLCGNHKIVELKTRDFWGNVSLKKFERLANLIFQNLYDCTAQIRIEDGCICVSWVIPDIDTSILVTVSPDLLKAVGVISLKIGDKVLYKGPNEGCHILESTFIQAVELGNVRAVELLLAVGCDSNIHTHTGELAITSAMKLRDRLTLFHLACFNGHADVVHILMEAGYSLEATTNNFVTPLMICSDKGHNEIVELLLKAKINPNVCLKDGTTAVYIASENGHSAVLSTLLISGADPSMAKRDGWNPLIIASAKGHNEVVELLVKAKVNPNVSLKYRTTPLFFASQNGHSAVVSTLLTFGADPNIADSDGWTPLILGSQNGHNDVVELLLKAKVNRNACNNNRETAIFMASDYGHSVVVSTLLASGADPNLADSDGCAPLLVASMNGYDTIVELLLKHKVDSNACNNNGETAIFTASANGHSDVVSILLKSGADPNWADSYGCTPLIIASVNCHNKVVELLLNDKVDPNVCNGNGETAIYTASQNGHSIVVSTLLKSGADLNIADSNGWTPLLIGSKNGHNAVVELLLDAKVYPNACNNKGATAIYLASENGHSVIVSALLKYGADPNLGRYVNGWTPLLRASSKGHTEVVKRLLEHSDINYQAVTGITALHLASKYGHIDIVTMLLDSDADATLVDSEGMSPFAYASINGHHDILNVLYEFKPLAEGLKFISLLSIDSCGTTDTDEGKVDITLDSTESSDYSDDMSLDSYPVTLKPIEVVNEIDSSDQVVNSI